MVPQPLPADLRRALGLLEADPARRWTLGALAAASGAAPRTLQKRFRSFFGCGPMHFLRDLRLDLARRDLLHATADASVTEVATRHGFNHLGRFSARYVQRYGEPPSATLRRHRSLLVRGSSLPPPRAVERPAIAVLPFDQIGERADGAGTIAEEVGAALWRLRWVTVTAPSASGYHVRGKVHGDPGIRAGHHFTPRPHEERAMARSLAARAAALGVGDPLTETLLACGYTLAHDLATAAIHVDRALALDGGSAWAWGRSGWIMAYAGRPAEAIERFQIARALAPADPLGFLWSVGIGAAHFDAARYEEAARWFTRGRAERPTAVWINPTLAPAYALAGRKEEARQTVAEWRRAFPGLTIAHVRSGLPYSPSFLDRVADGLESVGVPLQ